MVTIKDIAARLKVSPSTVTRALADNSRISAKTKAHVRAAAADMGYVADTAAKTMRSRESTLIGLLVPDIENSFYARIAKAFSDVCNSYGYQLTLAVSDDDPTIEERHIRAFLSARCAGIAIVPSPGITEVSIKYLQAKNAAQLVRRCQGLETDWYGINDVDAIRSAVDHLFTLGHRRVGLICGGEDLESARNRYAGYEESHKAQRRPVDPGLVQRGPPRAAFAQRATNRLVQLDSPPSAIIAAGASLSEGMLNAATSWRPRDTAVSLIGYSDCNAFKWWGEGGLSAIDLPIAEIARDLCVALIERAKDTANGAGSEQRDTGKAISPQDFSYDSRFILRGSVHPHRG